MIQIFRPKMNSMLVEITEDMKKTAWKFRRENAAVKGLIMINVVFFLNHRFSYIHKRSIQINP